MFPTPGGCSQTPALLQAPTVLRPPAMGKRGEGTGLRSRAFLLACPVSFCVAFLERSELTSALTVGRKISGKSEGESFIIKLFFMHPPKYSFRACVRGERRMAQCTWDKGEPMHAAQHLSVLLAEQRCPSELLDGPSGTGLQGLPGQHSCRAAQDEGGRAGKWRVLWTVLPRAAPVCFKLEPSKEGGDHPSAECNWPPTKGR